MNLVVRGSLLPVWATAFVLMAQSPSAPPSDPAPKYVESSVVNSASPVAGVLAPNTLATVYGQFLARSTRAISADDVRSGVLPTALPGTGAKVVIGGFAAPLLYVSPTQINFLVPSELLPGTTELRVALDNRYGPGVRVTLYESGPGLFLMDPEFVVATVASSAEVATYDRPAHPGDVVTLFATGLGVTTPRTAAGQIVVAAAPLTRMGEFRVELDGVPAATEDVLYAGLAPGFAGVYQVNFRLPRLGRQNPEIRVGYGNRMSTRDLRLHASND